MTKRSDQFKEPIIFVLIILSLWVPCQIHGDITNIRVPSVGAKTIMPDTSVEEFSQ